MRDPKLQHVLVLLAYMLVLWLLLMQATPEGPIPSRQQREIGTCHFRLATHVALPAEHPLVLTLTALSCRKSWYMTDVMLIPASTPKTGGNESVLAAMHLPFRRSSARSYEVYIWPRPESQWKVQLVIVMDKEWVLDTIPFPMQEPTEAQLALAWRIVLLTCALLVYALWPHQRSSFQDDSLPSREAHTVTPSGTF